MALLDKMAVDDLMRVRKMGADDALKFLGEFNLSATELQQAKNLVQVKDKNYDNRLWLTTAWLLGASFPMLAKDKGVSKQSIMVAVEKLLPAEERAKGRIGGMLSYEAMSEYKVAFFENLDHIRTLPPKEAAGWLITNVSLDQ